MKKTTRIFGVLLIAAMLLGAFAMIASAEGTAIPATVYVDVTNVTVAYDECWRATFAATEGSIDYIEGDHTLTQVSGETSIYSVAVPEGAADMYFAFDALGNHYTTRQLVPTDGRNLFVITGKSGSKYTGYWQTYDPNNGGVQPYASVTTATGTTTNYWNIDDAISAAVANAGSTLKLLGDVQPTAAIESGTFTLDLNGFGFIAPDGQMYAVYLKSGHLTIQDSSAAGTGSFAENARGCNKVCAYKYGTQADGAAETIYTWGTLTIHGGNFGDVSLQTPNSDTHEIYGGNFEYLVIQSDVTAALYGGEFTEIQSMGGNLSIHLASDHFFYDENGNLVLTDADIYNNVTVKKGADLANATVTVAEGTYTYNGSAITPGVTVTVLGKTVAPSNYTVTYTNNINAGEATVTVTGKDPYTGSAGATFTIEKATPVVTAPTPYEADHLIWTGLTKSMLKDQGSTTGGTLMYNVNGAAWGGITLAMDAGTYTIGYKVVGDENWNDVEPQYIDVVIEKRDFSNSNHRVSISLSESSFVYDGTEKTPTVTLPFQYWNGIEWRNYTIKTGNYEVSYSANVNAGTVTVTVTGVGNCTGTISTTFEIAPVALKAENFVLDADEFTYNGAEQKPAVTITVDGVTLVEGTDYTVSWPEDMTNAGTKTVTISGKNYSGSFTYEIKKADPTVTVTSPISKVLSGNKVLLSATASYGDLTDLPTEFVITSITNATCDGMVITVADGLVIGQDFVTVTVSSVETDNYNAVSRTIVLEVGMADYSTAIAELEAAIQALHTAIGNGDSELAARITELESALVSARITLENTIADGDFALEEKITEARDTLQAAIDKVAANLVQTKNELETAIKNGDDTLDAKIIALENALAEAKAALEAVDAANKTELEGKITAAQTALQAAIDKVTADLAQAKTELETAIKNGDDALDEKIAALNDALTNAQAALEAADAANKTELEGKITAAQTALQAAIDKVAADLAQAKTELETAIKNGDDALDEKIAALNDALTNAQTALEKADADNKAELESKIIAARTALRAAIDKVAADLAQAKTELETAIANGDTALEDKITALNSALAEVKAVLEAANAEDKAYLTGKIDEADAVLQAAIDALASELNSVKQALEKADADNRMFIIIVCVIASLALCGCGTIAVFYFIIDKKKI